ncbi:MAG: VWA domain-containing protein [Hyphomicrobiales bacterium]|nr:VWA domain-containing protein [Hyphomicrobiales bacterium]
MTGFLDLLGNFHFIRPLWLLLVPIALVLWWRIRTRATTPPPPPSGVAPHLAEALTIGEQGRRRLLPIDGVMAAVVFAALGAAGPAWTRVPSPFVAQTAPLAVALQVSESMMARDVQPTRLERAKHKILDLVEARAGARTALIAYGGTAHRVAPLTEDPEVLKPFLEALSPDIMPSDGHNASAALALASETLAGEEYQGAALFVVDTIDAADLPAFEENATDQGPDVVFLQVGGSDNLRTPAGTSVVQVSVDDRDITEIERLVASAWREALSRDENQQWADRGWLFAIPAALLALLWFRRGWTMRWSFAAVAAFAFMAGDTARAEGVADFLGGTVAGWFLTPDQQGQIAYNNKRFAESADLFRDPEWEGYALFRAGKYPEAAEAMARLDTADAAITEGIARIRNREYRAGIAAFEKALEREPDNEIAAHNLEVAVAMTEYIEETQEASDTGEEAGIGADEVRFDNESGRGAETQITAEDTMEIQTVDQWMRSVDTNASDFLRTRFALEANRTTP